MNKWLKFLVQAVSVLVLLYLTMVVLVFIFVKTKRFPPMISRFFYHQTGQVLKINGPVTLSLFPWPSVTVSDLVIGHPKGFEVSSHESYMAKVGKVSAHLRLSDLLRGKVRAANVVLDHLELNLITLKTGQSNWSHWISSQSPSRQASLAYSEKPIQTALFYFPAIHVVDGRLHFINKQSGSQIEIDRVSLYSPGSRQLKSRRVVLSGQIKPSHAKTWIELQVSAQLDLKPDMMIFNHLKVRSQWYPLHRQTTAWEPLKLMSSGVLKVWPNSFYLTLRGGFVGEKGTVSAVITKQKMNFRAQLLLNDVSLVPIARLMVGKSWIKGQVNASTVLSTQDELHGDWLHRLSGEGSLAVGEGRIEGLNVGLMVINAIQSLLLERPIRLAPPDGHTYFTRIDSHYRIRDGQLRVSDFRLSSPLIELTGEGTINLPAMTIEATLWGTDIHRRHWQVPIKITGPLFHPKIRPGLASRAKALLIPALKNAFEKDLKAFEKRVRGVFDSIK